MTLDELNAADPAAFVASLGPVFEHAPWVAERAATGRPFATVAALHQAMFDMVAQAPWEEQDAFLRGHPDLAGAAAQARTMEAFSTAEQDSLGLSTLDDARFASLQRMNAEYRERFGIPFMLCVRRHTRGSVLRHFERRLHGTPDAERQAALGEVFLITRLRIAEKVTGPGTPETTGTLTTHVLSTALGRAAEGIPLALFEIDAGAPRRIAEGVTNTDGRTERPLLSGAPLRIGVYELRFRVAEYFARVGLPTADPPFYDEIPIRFAIAEPESHYHVPLLVSPGGYTTYRGS